jgi:hypothetical protein
MCRVSQSRLFNKKRVGWRGARARDEIPKLETRNETDELQNTQGGPTKLQDVVSNLSDILKTSNPKFERFWGSSIFAPNDQNMPYLSRLRRNSLLD